MGIETILPVSTSAGNVALQTGGVTPGDAVRAEKTLVLQSDKYLLRYEKNVRRF